MIEQVSNPVKFVAFFTANKTGTTGLTVTVDIYNPSGSQIVTGGSATAIGGGLYSYTLSTNNSAEGEYAAIFKTTDTTVDSQHIPSLWVLGRAGVENLDAATSTRLASSGYTAPSAAPTVAAIRAEMDTNSTKLANLDATVSSRLATSGYTAPSAAPTVAAIRQEMDSNSTKLANLDASVSSRLASSAYSAAPTTAQIATAVEGSLLNEADGQAVLNAIVGAIGNTNVSEVSLVAAVRADLERVGGKIDSIPTTAAPTAAANATAVWGAASKTITGGTVDTLTNSPSVPSAASIASATRTELTTELGRLDAAVSTRLAAIAYTAASTAAQNAAAVRTELATELARVDAAVSTRLAGSAYTAPSNSDVAAIKAKTDLLETTRLAQCSTVATTGAQLAAALS
jgi:antitoxin component HigA of HigAB toxin-antitoxin module